MTIERTQNETLIRIPNSMMHDAEVRAFMDFLAKSTSKSTVLAQIKARDRFEELFQKWKSETALLSNANAIVSHPAYLAIIEMGESAVPFVLMKIQNDPQHLFYALFKMTGENPVPLAHAGDLAKMSADWIAWGRSKRYLD